jgi:spermidine/putrescine transport system permease protein
VRLDADTRAHWPAAVPVVVWTLVFLIAPLSALFAVSFFGVEYVTLIPKFTLDNYVQAFTRPLYSGLLLKTLRIAATVSLCCLVIAYPVAYCLATRARRSRQTLYMLIIVPLWISYLLRCYAWKVILGQNGVVNSLLRWLGLTEAPVSAFLYSEFALILTLTHVYVAFVLMPIYAALEKIPPELREAASDLYASPARAFWRVTLPLSLPGVAAGITFAFSLTLGDFVAATLVGGPEQLMIGMVVWNLFGTAFQWPLGAAISFIILALTLLLVALGERLGSMRRVEL